MNESFSLRLVTLGLRWLPIVFLAVVALIFGSLSPRFLTVENLLGILTQASWLIVAATGVNLVLLTAGVDLSVGATMYLTVACVGLALPALPPWLWPVGTVLIGGLVGCSNAVLIVRGKLSAFVATLALAFIARGAGLYFSSTQMVFASDAVSDFGRERFAGVPLPLWMAIGVLALSWVLMRGTPFGIYVRAVGADVEGARRTGLPIHRVLMGVYIWCGALAGLAGFTSFSQVSAASGAFGVNAEFLAIAAAVLGGTSLFGGRGTIWAPLLGAVLIITVQNGLVLIDSNPYAYPVVTGGVIFLAALFDSLRRRLTICAERRQIIPPIRRKLPVKQDVALETTGSP